MAGDNQQVGVLAYQHVSEVGGAVEQFIVGQTSRSVFLGSQDVYAANPQLFDNGVGDMNVGVQGGRGSCDAGELSELAQAFTEGGLRKRTFS